MVGPASAHVEVEVELGQNIPIDVGLGVIGLLSRGGDGIPVVRKLDLFADAINGIDSGDGRRYSPLDTPRRRVIDERVGGFWTFLPDIQVHVFPKGTVCASPVLGVLTIHGDSDIGDVTGSSISLQPDILELCGCVAAVTLLYQRSVSASDLQADCVRIPVVWPLSSNADIEDNAVGALEDGLVVEVVFVYGKFGAAIIVCVADLPSLSILGVFKDALAATDTPVALEPVLVRGG